MDEKQKAMRFQEFGCTSCHGGQGFATTTAGAHGDVEHWDEPLLDELTRVMTDASICGLGQTAAEAVDSAIHNLGVLAQ